MSDAALEIVFDHFYARRRRDIAALTDGLDPEVVHQGVFQSSCATAALLLSSA